VIGQINVTRMTEDRTSVRTWHRVASASALVEGQPIAAHIGDIPVAVVRADGAIYVIDDVCTHEYALLSGGFVEDCTIECPLHQAKFDLKTGRCLEPPADRDLRTYAVKVEGDDVLAAMEAA
jgi:3-phenylpropionate/trans-cinnamate dioxygenase ferredoxin subunit